MKTTTLFCTAAAALLVGSAPRVSAQYLPDTQPTLSTSLSMSELPAPVQNTVRKTAGDEQIARIHRDSLEGKSGYRVQFKERGRNPDIFVTEDGTLLQPREKPPGAKTLYMGTRFEDTPAAVQAALRREVGTDEIVSVDREGSRDTEYYRVRVKTKQGTTYDLRVNADGNITRDSRRDALGTKPTPEP